MSPALQRAVYDRAEGRCEYCRLPVKYSIRPPHIEHIRARSHGGSDDLSNLALACYHCNAYKGPNLAGIDPESGRITPLFHPRDHHWNAHFRVAEATILGNTDVGRATVRTLRFNDERQVELRRLIMMLENSNA